MSATANFQQLANFIWSVADLLRGPYRPPQYERVMLPLTVLRRFDAVLAPSKEAVLKRHAELSSKGIPNIDAILNNLAKDEDGKPLGFHNHSQLDFPKLKGDPDNIGRHLADYINGFSENIRKIFERFEFEKEIEKLEESNRLYQVVAQFAEIDLHPRKVDNITMGLVFEDLIRRFNEAANETAGDHFTPREVIQLMVNLLLEPDTSVLTQAGVIVTICDPACGTGGMLAEAQNWIRAHNEQATVKVFGQDYNPRSYAVAASDLLDQGHKDGQVVLGNTLTDDPFPDHRFDYLLANPPFGVDWKAEKKVIDRWPNFRGYSGKLPRINDGALLFLLYMMSKFQDYKSGDRDKPGSRTAIVFNGSPLFTGGAGSGESEIRRWIIERDQLEAIVALPEQMFYNTGIGTFIWVVTNRKAAHRKGKIQLIDARERYTPMKRSLGDKRRYLDQAALDAVTREHGAFGEQQDQPRIRQHRLRLSPHHRAAPAAPALRDHRRGARALPQHLPRAVRCPAGRAGRARQRTAAGLEPGLGRRAAGVQDLARRRRGLGQGRQGHGAEEDLPRLLHHGGPRGRARHRQAPQGRAAGPRRSVPRPDPARRHHEG
jgi:type I restriction enzyme M protein